ncbi:MAG: glucosaminidase domain-containing protein, partial [Chitinophagaceae bacterium]|nr:glucosaminidase domain-containing protein [Chitinophagaceae bacterium]
MRIALRSIFLLFLLASLSGKAQQSEAIKNYIAIYKDLAIAEMKRTGVPASITLAQGIHESGAGMGKLVLASNNHFGIKCKSNWTGESVRHNDDAKGECFRKYPKPEDSYRDHSDFLKNGQRYAFLFQLDPTDYTGWANGLKQAGYATNPKYPQVLIKMVEDYGLQEYTFIALGKTADSQYDLAELAKADSSVKEGDVKKTLRNSTPYDVIKKEEVKVSYSNYPEGQFTINETKVVYVKKGTSYLAIARQYNVDLSKLFEFNELDRAEETEKDQLVYLQRKRKTGANEYHVMKPGEVLHDIAQQQGIRLE